jgi:serine/threonine-protein kinase Chk2
MPPASEKSQLKRQRVSLPDAETESKKPRRSERLSKDAPPDKTPVSRAQQLPSPLTHGGDGKSKESTPYVRPDAIKTPHKPEDTHELSQAGLSSPPQDTQPMSQYLDQHPALAEEVEDEAKEGVWGYLVPLDPKYGDKPIVLKKRSACPLPETIELATKDKSVDEGSRSAALKNEEAYERTKVKGNASGGYLIGRHNECGRLAWPFSTVPGALVCKVC